MSLSVAGVWQVGVWDQTVWADGVWREGTPAVVATTTRAGGKPSRMKRRIILDGRRYDVDQNEEAQVLKAWVESLEQEKKAKQKELAEARKAQKALKKANPYKGSTQTEIAPYSGLERPTAVHLYGLIRSIQEIEARRKQVLKELKALQQEVDDEEEAVAMILGMMA